MKQVLKIIKYTLIAVAALFLLLMTSIIPDYFYYMPRAKPPQGVTNLKTFFEWKSEPLGAMKITTSNETYFQLLGPAGRWLPSGPVAYTFDSQGRFVGWTADDGDYFTPRVVYAPGAIRGRIPVVEVRALLKTNASAEPRLP